MTAAWMVITAWLLGCSYGAFAMWLWNKAKRMEKHPVIDQTSEERIEQMLNAPIGQGIDKRI